MFASANYSINDLCTDALGKIFSEAPNLRELCQQRRVCKMWDSVISALLGNDAFVKSFLIKAYRETPEEIEDWNSQLHTRSAQLLTKIYDPGPVLWRDLEPDATRPSLLVNTPSKGTHKFLTPPLSECLKRLVVSELFKDQSIEASTTGAIRFLLFRNMVTNQKSLKITLLFMQAFSSNTEIELARLEFISTLTDDFDLKEEKPKEAVIKCELRQQNEIDSFIKKNDKKTLETIGKYQGYKNITVSNHLSSEAFQFCRTLFLAYDGYLKLAPPKPLSRA